MHHDYQLCLLFQKFIKGIYTDILAGYETNRSATEQLIPHQRDESISNNYYYLIFDAMRMLPDFRDNHQQEQKKELHTWKSIITKSKANKEINTLVSDEELAKLFVYLGDGTNINLIINDNIDLKKNELKHLWDALYNSLKS
jgi:TetR/AcrR family transcriptional repressor of nem operon